MNATTNAAIAAAEERLNKRLDAELAVLEQQLAYLVKAASVSY